MKLRVPIILIILIISWTAYATYSFGTDAEIPFSSFGGEQASPTDWVKEDQIAAYNNYVVIGIKDVTLARYANTNSMDPLLDEGTTGLEIPPKKEKLKVGDIISYESKSFKDTIIAHRIIEIQQDEKGKYYIVKGDNNSIQDPEKVRFNQIKGVLVGIIY